VIGETGRKGARTSLSAIAATLLACGGAALIAGAAGYLGPVLGLVR